MAANAQIWLQVRPESHFQYSFEYEGLVYAPATRRSQTEALVHPENARVALGRCFPREIEDELISGQKGADQRVVVRPGYAEIDVQYLLSFYPVFQQGQVSFITPEQASY